MAEILPIVCSAYVENGSDEIELFGTDASTGDPVVLSDLNCRPNALVLLAGVGYLVKERIDTVGHVRLERPYEGADSLDPDPGVTCTLGPFTAEMASRMELSQQLRDWNGRTQLLAEDGKGLIFTYIGPTGLADPGPGCFSLDNASPSLATNLMFDVLDARGRPVKEEIGLWENGTVIIGQSIATGAWAKWQLTEAATDEGPGAWMKATEFAFIEASPVSLVPGELIAISYTLKGPQGAGYEYDAEADDASGLEAYEDQDPGYRVWLDDLGGANAGRGGVVALNDEGEWDIKAVYTGPVGPIGWTAVHADVLDGARVVEQLIGYVNGTGDEPTVNVGKYRGPAGYVTLKADATDVRGPTGRGFTPKGTYSAVTDYLTDDLALDNGSTWRALGATTGNAPPVLPTTSNTWWTLVAAKGTDGTGTGDVVGPAASVNNRIALFDGTTGKLLKVATETIADLVPANGSVTNAKLANMAFQTFKARKSAGTGAPEDATLAEVTAMLGVDAAQADILNLYLQLADANGTLIGFNRGWADAFDDETGIDASASANEAYDATNDLFAPTVATTTTTLNVHVTGSFIAQNFTSLDRTAALPNSSRIVKLGVYSSSANSITLKIANEDSSTQYDIVYSQAAAHPGGGWVDFDLTAPFDVPASGTYRAGIHVTALGGRTGTVARASITGNQAVGNNVSGWTADDSQLPPLRYTYVSSINNMTLISNAVAAPANVGLARAFLALEYAGALTPGTDFDFALSANSGSAYVAGTATLWRSSGDLKLYEIASINLTSQADDAVRARARTLTNKDIKATGLVVKWKDA